MRSPLQFLKDQEAKHKDAKGEVYLGIVMTLTYPAKGIEVGEAYFPFLLELTDVLKTPLRRNYRLLLKGFTDSLESRGSNLVLSRRRAENLKNLLLEKYYMKKERITIEGDSSNAPVPSSERAGGGQPNGRVEIHVYGDVSEAVRFTDKGRE